MDRFIYNIFITFQKSPGFVEILVGEDSWNQEIWESSNRIYGKPGNFGGNDQNFETLAVSAMFTPICDYEPTLKKI